LKNILIIDNDIYIGNVLEEALAVDIDNKVDLLLGGAVDYVTKPFNTKELLARIAVQLRNSVIAPVASTLTFDDMTLNTDTHIVTIGTR